MTIAQIINIFLKKKLNFLTSLKVNNFKIINFNPLIFLSFIVFFSILFFTFTNFINKKNENNKNNLSEVIETSEFSNLTNYFISKINSPYQEINYTIKSNDTIEKILKNYNIKNADIKNISTKLKEKKIFKHLFREETFFNLQEVRK